MLFKPTYKLNIIKESDFDREITKITESLASCSHSGYFSSFDKNKMFYEYFKVENPVASVVIVHGYTEFTKKYYEMCWYFMNMGYNVFLYDLRGHGYSHRHTDNTEVTHADKFEDYVTDLECYMNQIVFPCSENLPVYIYSHSMGSAIASLYVAEFPDKVKKAVLSSPMIYPVTVKVPGFILRLLLKNEARKFGWNTRFRFSSDFNPDTDSKNKMDSSLCRFHHNLNMRINDKNYRNTSATNRLNYEMLGVKNKILSNRNLKKIKAKIIIISAGDDKVVRYKPQKSLAKKLKCSHITIENAKHSLSTLSDKMLHSYVNTIMQFYAGK